MDRWLCYWAANEPIEVIQLVGYPRYFAVYDLELVLVVSQMLRSGTPVREVYQGLCERALSGQPDVKALPLDSPPWRRTHGRWRPVDEARCGR
jgi:hypothetical protein